MATGTPTKWLTPSPYCMTRREAAAVAKDIERRIPTLVTQLWVFHPQYAQIVVQGPSTRGVIDLVLHDRLEAETFLELLR